MGFWSDVGDFLQEHVGDPLRNIAEGAGLYKETDLTVLEVNTVRVIGNKTSDLSGGLGSSDRRNAFRHCLFTCYVCKALGASKALQVTNYHETFREATDKARFGTGFDRGDQRADLKNNVEGMKCCGAESCIECCLEADWWIKRRLGSPRRVPGKPLRPRVTTPGDTPPGGRRAPASGGRNEPDDGHGGALPPKKGPKEAEPEKDDPPTDIEPPHTNPFATTTTGSGGSDVGDNRMIDRLIEAATGLVSVVAIGVDAGSSQTFPPLLPPWKDLVAPEPPNYDPCDPPSNYCLGPDSGGGGGGPRECADILQTDCATPVWP